MEATNTTTTFNPATHIVRPKAAKRNFRSSADVENFYRFVSENNLRREAKIVLQAIMKLVHESKKKSKRESKKNLN